MSRNIKSATKFLQKEIEAQKNIVTTETLKMSISRENFEKAANRIQELEEQLVKLNGGAYASL